MLHRAMVATGSSCVRQLAGGRRDREMRFSRFLRQPAVTPEAIFADAAAKTGRLAKGREIVAIQDSSELVLGGAKRRDQGFGPVGKGGATRGLVFHPVLAVDALTGEVLGLAGASLWNRTGGKVEPKAKRAPHAKESRCWHEGAVAASRALARASAITLVSDRESDIYGDYALRPDKVHLLVRARHDRGLADGSTLSAMLARMAPAGELETVDIPAKPGHPARQAKLAVRFCKATIKRPSGGMPGEDLRRLPESLEVHVVEAREVAAPDLAVAIHWRLISTRPIEARAAALEMVGLYRKRWAIEEYFHTLKTGGFDIENAAIGQPRAMMALTAAAAVSAVTVMQLLKARDNPEGQAIAAIFDNAGQELLRAVNADYEGPHPTARQKNPYPKHSLAYATWIIARLGGWNGYHGKAGAKTLNNGLQAFHHLTRGAAIMRRVM